MRKKQQKLSSSQEASQSASCGILKENGGLQLQTLGIVLYCIVYFGSDILHKIKFC